VVRFPRLRGSPPVAVVTSATALLPDRRRTARPGDELMGAAVSSLHRAVLSTKRTSYQFNVKWGKHPEITALINGGVDLAYVHALFGRYGSGPIELGPPYGRTGQRNATAWIPSLGVTLTVVFQGG